ncbi:hypothetical protein Ahy_A09g045623 isoform B [Arachis hypogaea]|uniref:Uncharacterized protein n=1 Tax=Arachis hypogaea TaxID=3818 RepID=A0A445BMV4_ARAHY|nr:hypothetical protein Ahy_A09g045623 isoform B [Arachis hypogaea]
MRIRKRQVPFPLSQVSPDPNRISRSPVMVQLNQAAPADVATSSKRSCTDVSAAAPAHSLDPSQPSDQTLHPPIGEDGELARLPRKKKQEYLVEDEDGKTQEEGEGGQKGNDTRKACNMGSETPPDALSPSSTTCKQGKGRLRSMTSVRSRSIATPTTAGAPKKLHRQLVPPSDNEAANSSSSYSNNNAKETNCVVARHDDDGYANHHAGGGGEDDHDDEKKPMTVTTKKRVKLGTVKARSISSLLGQTNNEIAMPDNNNNNVN